MSNNELDMALISLAKAKVNEIAARYKLGLAIFHTEEVIKELKGAQDGN